MRRVVITGIGIVAPTGVGREAFWTSIRDGRSAYGRITRFDASSYSCGVGGEATDTSYESVIDPRKLRTAPHVTRLALGASELAMRDAKLSPGRYAPELVGVVVGTAIGGWNEAEQQCAVLLERGARRVNPFVVSGSGNHGPGIEIAAAIGAQGQQFTFSSGCPSSSQAIGYGAGLVASGNLDLCIVGGTESPLSPLGFAALCRTQELSTFAGDPACASRPFDRAHTGMVLSEGSCCLVLEAADQAARRGALAYAEVCGWASSCDAQGLYQLDQTGRAGARAIHQVLRQVGATPADVDYVCAHANSSPAFDRKEAIVLRVALGEFAAKIPVSSIKGVLGHPFGASGAFQTAATALAIREQIIPPTHNLEEPDPDCQLHHVVGKAQPIRLRRALVTSYGYGGVNTYVLLAAPPL